MPLRCLAKTFIIEIKTNVVTYYMGFITIVSGHYPSSTHYATLTKQILETYCQRNHYDFYYDNSEPDEKNV